MLQNGGVGCILQRTPKWREEKGCGYCLRLRSAQTDRAVALLRQYSLPFSKIYADTDNGAEEWRI